MKTTSLSVFVLVIGSAAVASAVPVTLQQATATYSQTANGLDVNTAIDGITPGLLGFNGWAIGNTNFSQTAVFETATDVGVSYGTTYTFKFIQQFGTAYTLGKFRLSVTTDDRNTFADNGQNGGNVTANWIELTPLTASDTLSQGQTFTINGDNSISVTGFNPDQADYTVTAVSYLPYITGIRLEAIKVPADNNTPGRTTALNGNFVLNEFQVSAVNMVPEPSSMVLALSGLAFVVRRRR